MKFCSLHDTQNFRHLEHLMNEITAATLPAKHEGDIAVRGRGQRGEDDRERGKFGGRRGREEESIEVYTE